MSPEIKQLIRLRQQYEALHEELRIATARALRHGTMIEATVGKRRVKGEVLLFETRPIATPGFVIIVDEERDESNTVIPTDPSFKIEII